MENSATHHIPSALRAFDIMAGWLLLPAALPDGIIGRRQVLDTVNIAVS